MKKSNYPLQLLPQEQLEPHPHFPLQQDMIDREGLELIRRDWWLMCFDRIRLKLGASNGVIIELHL